MVEKKKRKEVKASSVSEAKQKLDADKVVNVGGNTFKTPEQVSKEQQTTRVISGVGEVTPEEYSAYRANQPGTRQGAVGGMTPRIQERLKQEGNLRGIAAIEQQQQEKQQVTEQLEQAGAFEQVTPTETNLVPEQRVPIVENLPIVGPSAGAVTSVLVNAVDKGFIPFLKTRGGEAEQEFPIPMTDETIREAALREISIKSYKKGISAGESFGSFVESIPIAGSLASKYAGGLVEAPSSNAKTVLEEINSERERASTGAEKVRNGLMPAGYGLEQARIMEENIAELKGRIKLLINTSPILRANRDEINKIQEQILRAEERIQQFKTASQFALTAENTGTGRVIPTDEQIYFELKELSKK